MNSDSHNETKKSECSPLVKFVTNKKCLKCCSSMTMLGRAQVSAQKITNFRRTVLSHPPPDLTPSAYHLFGPLKNRSLRECSYTSEEALQNTMFQCLLRRERKFYEVGIHTVV